MQNSHNQIVVELIINNLSLLTDSSPSIIRYLKGKKHKVLKFFRLNYESPPKSREFIFY